MFGYSFEQIVFNLALAVVLYLLFRPVIKWLNK